MRNGTQYATMCCTEHASALSGNHFYIFLIILSSAHPR